MIQCSSYPVIVYVCMFIIFIVIYICMYSYVYYRHSAAITTLCVTHIMV